MYGNHDDERRGREHGMWEFAVVGENTSGWANHTVLQASVSLHATPPLQVAFPFLKVLCVPQPFCVAPFISPFVYV